MIEYRGYKISINKGDKLRKVEVRNERGKYNFSRLLNAKGFINACQFDKPSFILGIIDAVLRCNPEYVWRGNYDVIAAVALNNGLFANLWADIENDKAEVTFINIAPIDTDKPMNTLIMEYYCDFYQYTKVESVKKIDNRLIIKFR